MYLIHVIPKWPSFKYSFVFIQISPSCLVLKLKIEKNILSWTRQQGTICMRINQRPFWNKVYNDPSMEEWFDVHVFNVLLTFFSLLTALIYTFTHKRREWNYFRSLFLEQDASRDINDPSWEVKVIPQVIVFHHMLPNLRHVRPCNKIFHILCD